MHAGVGLKIFNLFYAAATPVSEADPGSALNQSAELDDVREAADLRARRRTPMQMPSKTRTGASLTCESVAQDLALTLVRRPFRTLLQMFPFVTIRDFFSTTITL